jgi:hypothetical protein
MKTLHIGAIALTVMSLTIGAASAQTVETFANTFGCITFRGAQLVAPQWAINQIYPDAWLDNQCIVVPQGNVGAIEQNYGAFVCVRLPQELKNDISLGGPQHPKDQCYWMPTDRLVKYGPEPHSKAQNDDAHIERQPPPPPPNWLLRQDH